MTTMGTATIRMTLRWRVALAGAPSIVFALQALMVRTRTAAGCTGCSLSTEVDGQVEIRYVADWEREGDLQDQIRSSDFTRLAELMERATEPPTIQFMLPTGACGLEYAEKVRQ
jgi:quinol monooxygenase YgiN